jgi:hypothetical protein
MRWRRADGRIALLAAIKAAGAEPVGNSDNATGRREILAVLAFALRSGTGIGFDVPQGTYGGNNTGGNEGMALAAQTRSKTDTTVFALMPRLSSTGLIRLGESRSS